MQKVKGLLWAIHWEGQLTISNHLIHLGLYLLQLFPDLHHLYSKASIFRVDSDTTIICESYNQVIKTVDALKTVDTPKLAKLLELLSADEYHNVTATFDLGYSIHKIRLNEKITQHGNIHIYAHCIISCIIWFLHHLEQN